jgi:uncharacterized membrane protein
LALLERNLLKSGCYPFEQTVNPLSVSHERIIVNECRSTSKNEEKIMQWIKFLHVTLTVTLVGGILANYFYISLCIKENATLLNFVLRQSLFLDCIFFLPIIVIGFATGSYLVMVHHFHITPSWIFSAYLFFTLVILCWLIAFAIKSYNYLFLQSRRSGLFFGKTLFHLVNSLMLLLFVFIIHDAVRKTTFIAWKPQFSANTRQELLAWDHWL